MQSKQHFTITSVLLALILCFSLVSVNSALADDSTPTEPANATEAATEGATEPPVEATATPAESTATPVPAATTSPAPTQDPAGAEDESLQQEAFTQLISQMPETTDVLVLDENGDSVALVSQEAADIMVEADPMWCPEGVPPNGPGCTTNLTISDLLALMQTNAGGTFSQNGVIYFERASNITYSTAFILDDSASSLGASYDTIKNYSITLQGGWAGGSSSNVTSQTDFLGASAFVQVGSSTNPWVGNVTINDIKIGMTGAGNGVSTNNSLTVYTTDGDISLSNVDVRQQEGNHYTALLDSTNGDITVGANANGNPSLFDGDNSSGKENKGLSATTNTGSISISDTTFQDALANLANRNDGATLSAPVITLSNVIVSDADGNGIFIQNANTVTLNNVTSGFIDPNLANPNHGNGLSGVYVSGTGATILNINGGTFQDNGRYGVELINSTLYEHAAPTCTNNGLGTVAEPCYNITPSTPVLPTPTPLPTNTPANTPIPTATATLVSSSGGGGLIPQTGSGLLDLSCLTTVNVFGIRVTFYNLCHDQSDLNRVDADQLPAALPKSTTLIAGLEILVFNQGKLADFLPAGAGIQMDFPRPAGAPDEYAVLYWDVDIRKWIEISQEISTSEVSGVLGSDPVDELYILTPEPAESDAFKALTTEKTGIFVLIKK